MFDAKVQELIENRIHTEFNIDNNEIRRYLRNISHERMGTMINFLLKCIDKVSLKEKESDLFKELEKINSKRNKIIHEGENATRSEAKNALLTVTKALSFLNKEHKGKFDIPNCLLDDQKNWMWL